MYWRMSGTKVKIARRPRITLGTAARSSTRNVQRVGEFRRRKFGQKDRGAHPQRNGNRQRDERCQHRSVDEGQRAELLGHRIPGFPVRKLKPNFAREGPEWIQSSYTRNTVTTKYAGRKDKRDEVCDLIPVKPEVRKFPRTRLRRRGDY